MKIALVAPRDSRGIIGGAENLYQGLLKALKSAGHDADLIEILVDESTFEGILEAYCNCFYLDLSSYDLVISTKAPTYMVRHRNHVSYLLHTIRVFYDMFDEELDPNKDEIQKQRRLIQKLDEYGLNPVRIKKHAIIGNIVADRLRDSADFWNHVNFEVIYPAPIISNYRDPKPGEFIFLPGRLHRWKRVDLVIRAMKYIPSGIRLLIAGDGEEAAALRSLAKSEGLENRIEFLGRISEDGLLDMYSRSIVVPFVPIKEDYGYVTIEAFKSKKPVITCGDSGEPCNIIKDGFNGYIVDPNPKKIAEKINFFIENPSEAMRMGENGFSDAEDISWDRAVKRLLDIPQQSIPQIKKIKKRVLVTDNQILDPPIGGGRVRIYELYKNFDPKKFDITYLGTFDWLGPEEREQKLAEHFTEMLVPLTVPHIIIDKIISKLCNNITTLDVTIPLLMRFTPKYQRRLSRLLKESDIVVVSHPWVYPYVCRELKKTQRKIVLIYDSHNVEYKIKYNLFNNSILGRLLANKVKNVEGALVRESDLIFTCSKDDAKNLSEIYGIEEDEKFLVIPNGSAIRDVPYPTQKEKASMKEHFKFNNNITSIFLASGGYKPNDDAAEYIATELAPGMPNILFVLVGSICDSILKKYKNYLINNIRLMGVVSNEEKKGILYAADFAINPVTMGSGTNIKVFDYIAAGLPLLTTPVGARGIDFTNGEDAIIAEIEEFPNQIDIIANNRDLMDRISRNARQLAEKYDWEKIAKAAENGIFDLEECPE